MSELTTHYDVVIIGAGLAGLYCGLCLPESVSVLMISKAGVHLNNSSLAQGGIAAVMDDLDDFRLHVKDTLIAGGYGNDVGQVERLVEHGPYDIRRLIDFGVNFDHTPDGKIDLTLEGGHSRRRIAHCKDSTGAEIVDVLLARVRERENITLIHDTAVLKITKTDGVFSITSVASVARLTADSRDMRVQSDNTPRDCNAPRDCNTPRDCNYPGDCNTPLYYTTKRCVIATGGIGGIYKYTTNSAIATGDGIRFAYELGARIKNLSRVQFHPTAFAGTAKDGAVSAGSATDTTDTRRFLISEAVRGEGAYLLNRDGERFMPKYEPVRKELAPRDVVSGCIMAEQERIGSDRFYIDITHVPADTVRTRFPMIHARLLEYGYDMTAEPVPIYPCQHYLMGGIDVDGRGRTTVSGLYAAGECAHTGVHGNNRLASNSLLEAIVFSRFIAGDITAHLPADRGEAADCGVTPESGTAVYEYDAGLCDEIRGIMTDSFFVVPNLSRARVGLVRLNSILRREDLHGEIRSLATVSRIILEELTDYAELAG